MPSATPNVGVVVVTGGPQYRAGSHRQFVLLARDLAARQIAVLRFDCRGMGDSDGQFPGFTQIGPDIAAALAAFNRHVPTVHRVVLWGLCDATLGICGTARRDSRIAGCILLNPWVRSDAGYARTQLKHYYLDRLLQRDFLRKALRGEVDIVSSARSLASNILRAFFAASEQSAGEGAGGNSLAEQMAADLRRFDGPVLIILSGRDLTAKEFEDAAASSTAWRSIMSTKRVTTHRLSEADHTFSRREWRDQVAMWTADWIRDMPVGG